MSLTKATYSMINGAVVNVLDYGAVGDGVADDTAAIQAAINDAATGTYDGDVFFPRGEYRTTTALTITGPQNIRLKGEGGLYTASTIKIDHNGAGIYSASDQTFNAENLVFEGDRTTYPLAFGIKVDGNSVGMTINKCTFSDFGNAGVFLQAAFACILRDCLFVSNGRAGLIIVTGAGSQISAPTFQDNFGAGLEIGGTGHTVTTPFFENNCKTNDPAGANQNWRELLITGFHITVTGGTLNTNAQNNKTPIEITGNMVTIDGMRPFSAGTAAEYVFVNGITANAELRNFPVNFVGNVTQVIQSRAGVPGSFTPDYIVGGLSLVSGAVVSSGTNVNGKFIRYENGLQICLLNGFYTLSGAPYDATWTFPATFVNSDVFVGASKGTSDPAFQPNAKLNNVKAVTATNAILNFSDDDITYVAFAVGFWK